MHYQALPRVFKQIKSHVELVQGKHTGNCMPANNFDDWSYLFSIVESTRLKLIQT